MLDQASLAAPQPSRGRDRLADVVDLAAYRAEKERRRREIIDVDDPEQLMDLLTTLAAKAPAPDPEHDRPLRVYGTDRMQQVAAKRAQVERPARTPLHTALAQAWRRLVPPAAQPARAVDAHR